jgi:hypothetical protein
MRTGIKCDFHIHSQFSDGRLSISEIVDLYGMAGFGAIAITDHLCEQKNIIGRVSRGMNYSLTRKNIPLYLQTLNMEAQRAWAQYKMLVIPGFEITKNSFSNHRSAHLLILGVEEFPDPDLPIEEHLAWAKSNGALSIAAHPFPTGELEFQTFYLWSRRQDLAPLIDAWEVNYRRRISKEMMGSGLPLIANSDFHHRLHFTSWKTKVFAEKSQSSIFHAIRSQNIDFFLDRDGTFQNKSQSLLGISSS